MKLYILYDGRSCDAAGTDDAAVFVSCDDMKEAKSYKGEFGDMACYSYDIKEKELINETWEWDYYA